MSHHQNLLQEIERAIAALRSPPGGMTAKEAQETADLLNRLAHMVREANWREVQT